MTTQAVFLSYASQDADAARRICDALREAGLEVWFDQSELRGGDAWDALIRKQIKECALFVPMISAATDARSEGYFRLEWKLAVDRSHLMADDQLFFVPLMIDDIAEPTARVPDAFRTRQWSRLRGDKSIIAFAERMSKLLAGSVHPAINTRQTSLALANLPSFAVSSSNRSVALSDGQATSVPFDAVRANGGNGGNGDITSIAVMPFLNMSNDADNEYFCDGLAEELLNALSKVKALQVVARSSSFAFKGKTSDAREVGQKLNVREVLEGSVKKSGNRLRISVQLVNVADGFHLWSERYDREMKDIFDIQDEITLAVVDALKVELLGGDKPAVLKRPTENTEAYELYLKGRYHLGKVTKTDTLSCIAYFQQAIELDPDFALAYVGISDAYFYAPSQPFFSPIDAFPQAKAAAIRALEIDPTLADVHVALANVLAGYDRNWPQAEKKFRRALELDPNNAMAHMRYGGSYLVPQGRFDEAVAEIKRALELEPMSGVINVNLTAAYYYSRQNERALMHAKKTVALLPGFRLGFAWFAIALVANGMFAEAIAQSEKALQADPNLQIFLMIAGVAYAKSERRLDAFQCIEKLTSVGRTQYLMSYRVAFVYAALGEKDKAFAELENAFSEHDWWLDRLKFEPMLDPIRDDPRCADLVRRMGLMP